MSFPLQHDTPPYESRITTAKLLIESEEYEVRSVLFALRRLCTRACLSVSVSGELSEGVKALPAPYPLQSSASIIEKWYLPRKAGVKPHEGGGGGRRRLQSDEMLPYL